MATIEYRKLFRAHVCLKVMYKAVKDLKIEGVSFSRNISSTGISLIILDSLKEGDELALEIFIPQETKPVTARGKIVWQRLCTYLPQSKKRYYSTGIHFLDMASEDAIKTSDFIGEVLRKQKEEEDKTIIEKIESITQNESKD